MTYEAEQPASLCKSYEILRLTPAFRNRRIRPVQAEFNSIIPCPHDVSLGQHRKERVVKTVSSAFHCDKKKNAQPRSFIIFGRVHAILQPSLLFRRVGPLVGLSVKLS